MRLRRQPAAVLTLALVASIATVATPTQAASSTTRAPVSSTDGLATQRAPFTARGPKGARPDHDPHRVLVKFAGRADQAARDRALKRRDARAVGRVEGTSFVVVRGKGRAIDLAARLQHDPAIAAVTLDYVRVATATPNDPGFAYGDQDYLKSIRLPEAWDRSRGSSTSAIAILDSGINGQHEDLTGRVTRGFNAITDTAIDAGAASDDAGHGSMVASIAAAITNNGKGIAGAAWTSRVIPVKVLDSEGRGYDSDIAQGIVWAANNGAKIINVSLGGPQHNPLLDEAVAHATAKGALVIAAVGNMGGNVPMYPAAIPNVLAVGATDSGGRLTDFSNFGDWVDIAAPGWGIVGAGTGNQEYLVGDGTSSSAPLVAGVAALVRTKYPTYTPAQIARRIKSTARDAGPRGIDPYYGAGFLDAAAAVGAAAKGDLTMPSLGTNEPNDVPVRATAMSGSATGTLALEGDVDWFKYTSTSSEQSMSVTVTPAPFEVWDPQNIDPTLEVYTSDLRVVGKVDASAMGQPEQLDLTMGSGTYYIAVRAWNGARSTKPYSLTVAATAPQLFQPGVDHAAGAEAASVTSGDVTGDGVPDAVAAVTAWYNSSAHDLVVFPGTASGTFGAAMTYATTERSEARGAVLADVDGDERLDVVVPTGIGVQVFRQQAEGTLAAPELIASTAGAASVVAADFDLDGDTDLIYDDSAEQTLLNRQADGSYDRSVVAPASAWSLGVGDVDGDGRPDLVTNQDGILVTNLNKATGWVSKTYDVPASDLTVADVTADGRDDVTVTSGGNIDARVRVLKQLDGSLSAQTPIPVTDIPVPIEAGDITHDGRTDVAVLHSGWGTLSVLRQKADAALDAPITSGMPYQSHYGTSALTLADFDDNGRLDAAFTNNTSIRLLRNAGGVTPGTEKLWVSDVAPADAHLAASLTSRPRVKFARALDPATVTGATVRLTYGRTGGTIPASVSYDAATRTATLTPSLPLWDNTPFRITVKGVKDSAGATMSDAFSTTFNTVNTSPPSVKLNSTRGNYGSATIAWQLPRITDLSAVIVRRATGSTAPSSPSSGTAVYSGTGTSVSVKGLASGVTYTYGIWVKDKTGRYSSRVTVRHLGTAISVSSSRTTVPYGYTVYVRGKLVRKDNGSAVSGATVELWQRRRGTTTWILVGTVKTSSTGTISKSVKPSSTRDYRWIYRGATTYMGSASATRLITVT
ncbi:S8 family serine peptidase [Intrasporangium sp. DVR]|uniref:S8 family serine peptidase n=1 Tax=Intrasporangium sp. DVR TaxID=3127867 RepID=UPI00333FEF98